MGIYIGTSVTMVDSLLIKQHPPHEFSRSPRSIAKHRKHWKASEYRNWLLYYSLRILCISKMPPLHTHHFSLLVCAIHILLKPELCEAEILAAELMLKDFYEMLPNLYGINSCTLNAHSLTHLSKFVRLWGPLWMHSLFGYENLNSHLTSMIHSGHKVAEQLAFALDVCQTIGSLADKLAATENDKTIKFLSSMSSLIFQQHKNMMCILPRVYSIGKVQFSDFNEEEKKVLQKFTDVSVEQINTFHKIYYKDFILHSHQCDKGKRNSSVCSYKFKGKACDGVLQKFCFSPPLAIIKPFKMTNKSILQKIVNPDCEHLKKYVSTVKAPKDIK